MEFTHSRPTVVTHWSRRLRGSVTFFNGPRKRRRRCRRWRCRRRQHIPFLPAYGNFKSCELSFSRCRCRMGESGPVCERERESVASETDDSGERERTRPKQPTDVGVCLCVCAPHMYNSSAHLPTGKVSQSKVAKDLTLRRHFVGLKCLIFTENLFLS